MYINVMCNVNFWGGLYTSRQIVMLITFAVRLTMENPVRYFLPDVQRFI